MFINCKHCNALVATDPATDLPPERCPRCAGVLREPAGTAANPMPVAPAVPDAATPTISSLLVLPVEPGRLAMLEVAAAGATASEAPVAEVVEEAVEAVAEPAPMAPAGEVEEAPVAPVTGAPVALAAVEGVDDAIAAAGAAADGANPTATVDAVPMEDAADGIESPATADAGTTTIDAEPAPSATGAGPGSTPARTPAPDDDTRDAGDAAAMPSFLPARPRAAAPRRWLPPAIIATLALLLGLQVLLADRARLAADAQWRPLVLSLCNVFGCDVPAWREPSAFTLLARAVRPHPQAAGALRVDATFRNDARWPQAWPRLLLTLSDVEGRPVAARAFDPREYLAEPADAATLDSGGSARIRIDLREPAAATVSYSFDFR